MKSLFIIVLLVFVCEIKTRDDQCTEYEPVDNIRECIGKSTGKAHYGCCGLSIKEKERERVLLSRCLSIPNTKAARDWSNETLETRAKAENVTVDLQCSSQEDEIKGTCEDFADIMVNSINDCIKLTESNNTLTCCGLKARQKLGKDDDIIMNFCLGLPINKNERDKFIKEIGDSSSGNFIIDEYICGNDYYSKKFILIICICSMILLF